MRKKFDQFEQRIVEIGQKGLAQRKVHFVMRDCGSLSELDFFVNELTNANYKIVEILPMHSEFFASYNVIAYKPIHSRRKN